MAIAARKAVRALQSKYARQPQRDFQVKRLFTAAPKSKDTPWRDRFTVKTPVGERVIEEEWDISGRRLLGSSHLLAYQAALSLCRPTEGLIKHEDKDNLKQVGEAVFAGIGGLEGYTQRPTLITATTTFYGLAQAMGQKPHGKFADRVIETLGDLAAVYIECKTKLDGKKTTRSFHLISSFVADEGKGKITICFDPIATRAVMGTPFVRVDMSVIRKLKAQPAHVLYTKLCSMVYTGETRHFTFDTLSEAIWGPETLTAAIRREELKHPDKKREAGRDRWRRHTLRAAVAEIKEAFKGEEQPWKLTLNASGLTVKRPGKRLKKLLSDC